MTVCFSGMRCKSACMQAGSAREPRAGAVRMRPAPQGQLPAPVRLILFLFCSFLPLILSVCPERQGPRVFVFAGKIEEIPTLVLRESFYRRWWQGRK